MQIRPAIVDDAVDIRKLILQLGYDVEISYISKRIKSADTFVFVAQDNDKILGLVGGIIFEYFHKPMRVARLDSLIIEEKSRRQGLGKKLVAHFEQEAENNNCTLIELSSNLRRIEDGTYSFYEGEGYLNQTDCGTTYFRKYL